METPKKSQKIIIDLSVKTAINRALK